VSSNFKNIFLVLILGSQLWVNTISYCYDFITDDVEVLEFLEIEEKESEELEKENKTEKELQQQIDILSSNFYDFLYSQKSFENDEFSSSLFSKIEIPPPEF